MARYLGAVSRPSTRRVDHLAGRLARLPTRLRGAVLLAALAVATTPAGSTVQVTQVASAGEVADDLIDDRPGAPAVAAPVRPPARTGRRAHAPAPPDPAPTEQPPTPRVTDRSDDRREPTGDRRTAHVTPESEPGGFEQAEPLLEQTEASPDPEGPSTAHRTAAAEELGDLVITHRDPRPFAAVGTIELLVPSRSARLIGFHQASYPTALAMGPLEGEAPSMRTLPTRGRPTPPRSAVDVAVVPGTPVIAPVTGTVEEVRSYALYGKYPDQRVEITPKVDPSKEVTVLHVSRASVARGDEVVAGETPIAGEATQFPFESQIDRFAGPGPHVHVEVSTRTESDDEPAG